MTRKPLSLKTPRLWGEEEMDQLKALYEEFKDAMDPIGRIRERMKVQRPKKRVIEKIFGELWVLVQCFMRSIDPVKLF